MVFYEDQLGELGKLLDEGGHHSIMLVTGKDSYRRSGAEALLSPLMEGRKFVVVSGFETNPRKADVVRILTETQNDDYSAIIAVGGGSVMDMAKLVKCFKGRMDEIGDVLHNGRIPQPSDVGLFAVPTTAGSGSEATHFAVVYDGGEKFSVAYPALLPEASWLLPSVLATVPQDVAAAAAMDAFCQGVESYWNIHSTALSKSYAREAIELSWEYMVPAVLQRDAEALEIMARASHFAGKAINITKTTAPHAVSYAFTTYFGVPHGHAVALMLPEILVFNERVEENDLLDERGCDYVRSVIYDLCGAVGCDDVKRAANAIRKRMEDFGLSRDLSCFGINNAVDLEVIVENGFNPGRVNNNPRRLGEGDLRRILNSMLKGC